MTEAPFPDFDGSQNCAGVDTERFFPSKGQDSRNAKKVCRGCSWVTECAAYAMTAAVVGVWGGLSDDDRRWLRKAQGIPTPRTQIGHLAPGKRAKGKGVA